ncbi:hypothetical protein Vi05172_g11831 [Venturia inaequalis]|nr:hypothetical protein Vi05172_g11831 [Venturia inaequalis]
MTFANYAARIVRTITGHQSKPVPTLESVDDSYDTADPIPTVVATLPKRKQDFFSGGFDSSKRHRSDKNNDEKFQDSNQVDVKQGENDGEITQDSNIKDKIDKPNDAALTIQAYKSLIDNATTLKEATAVRDNFRKMRTAIRRLCAHADSAIDNWEEVHDDEKVHDDEEIQVDNNNKVQVQVEKDEEVRVGKDEEVQVEKDEEVQVEKDEEVQVEKDEEVQVEKDEEVQVDNNNEVQVQVNDGEEVQARDKEVQAYDKEG